MKRIEIMDTTLRDGEQTSGVSFMPHEKLLIARFLLQQVRVSRIEVASARVSAGEKESVGDICAWAAKNSLLERVEVLGFVDGGECRMRHASPFAPEGVVEVEEGDGGHSGSLVWRTGLHQACAGGSR